MRGFFVLLFGILGVAKATRINLPTCEPIKIDMCRSIGYNMTGMPNLAKNTLQSDAKFELDTYGPLIQTGCANELQFFLCSVYAPMCVNVESNSPQSLIGPCQPLCERVKSRCLPELERFGYDWPEALNCSKFPEVNGYPHMCMEGPGESQKPLSLPPSSLNTLQTNPLLMEKVKERLSNGKLPDKYKNYNKFLQLLGNVNKQEPAKVQNI